MGFSSAWLLLIPIVFGLGWLSHWLENRASAKAAKTMPEAYFRGLNLLLNDKPDEAVAAFEVVAQLDPETVELYFALAKLFRRRGEQDRAIRVHRNLLERASLPQAAREQALFELAQDYLNAGIFDRSESAFKELAGTQYATQAQLHLARLYEKESNWAAALAHIQRYLGEANTLNLPPKDLARAQEDGSHYACELAQTALQLGQTAQTAQHLDTAAQLDANNSRIALLRASLAIKQQDLAQAMNSLHRAVLHKPQLAAHAVNVLHQADQLAHCNAEQIDKICQWLLAQPDAVSFERLSPWLSATQQAALLNALSQYVKQKPIAAGYAASKVLSQAAQSHGDGALATQAAHWHDAAQVQQQQLASSLSNPVCSYCGFRAKRHQWRCPGCNRWGGLSLAAG